jgi:hypothetical protein
MQSQEYRAFYLSSVVNWLSTCMFSAQACLSFGFREYRWTYCGQCRLSACQAQSSLSAITHYVKMDWKKAGSWYLRRGRGGFVIILIKPSCSAAMMCLNVYQYLHVWRECVNMCWCEFRIRGLKICPWCSCSRNTLTVSVLFSSYALALWSAVDQR